MENNMLRNKMGTCWEPDGNTLGTCWEPDGNTLGTKGKMEKMRKKQKLIREVRE
jgi:hypothetical protein